MNRTGFQDIWVPLYPTCLFYAFKDVILRSSSLALDSVTGPHSDPLSMEHPFWPGPCRHGPCAQLPARQASRADPCCCPSASLCPSLTEAPKNPGHPATRVGGPPAPPLLWSPTQRPIPLTASSCAGLGSLCWARAHAHVQPLPCPGPVVHPDTSAGTLNMAPDPSDP